MKERDHIQALASVFGPVRPRDDDNPLVQRNVRIRSYNDAILANFAKSADLPYGTIVNMVLDAGLQALEERMGTEAFAEAADFGYGYTDDGEETKGPITSTVDDHPGTGGWYRNGEAMPEDAA